MIDATSFLNAHAFFKARSITDIEGALAYGRLKVSRAVCDAACGGDTTQGESLYDGIVALEAEVRLLSDQTGLPTSQTREADLTREALARLKELRQLATPRFGVAGGC